MTADAGVEDLLRELAPRVLGVLVRRDEDFAPRSRPGLLPDDPVAPTTTATTIRPTSGPVLSRP